MSNQAHTYIPGTTLQEDLAQTTVTMVPQNTPLFTDPTVQQQIFAPYRGANEAEGAAIGFVEKGGITLAAGALLGQLSKLIVRPSGFDADAAKEAMREIGGLTSDKITEISTIGGKVNNDVHGLLSEVQTFVKSGSGDASSLAERITKVSGNITTATQEHNAQIPEEMQATLEAISSTVNNSSTHVENGVEASDFIGDASEHLASGEKLLVKLGDELNIDAMLDKAKDALQGKAGLEIDPTVRNVVIASALLAAFVGAYKGVQSVREARTEHDAMQFTAASLADQNMQTYQLAGVMENELVSRDQVIQQQAQALHQAQTYGQMMNTSYHAMQTDAPQPQPDTSVSSMSAERLQQPRALAQSAPEPASHLSRAEQLEQVRAYSANQTEHSL